MLKSKIVHLKEICKFHFDHFLDKRTMVLIFIKKMLLKIKSCSFWPNNARYEKMLKSKIVHLKKIYNFDFDNILIKRTVFVLIVKNVIKNKKFNFPDKFCDIRKKMLRNKIVRFKKIYKFYFDHFLIKRTVFVLMKKMLLKIKSCGFRPNNARYEKMLTSKIVHLNRSTNFIFTIF